MPVRQRRAKAHESNVQIPAQHMHDRTQLLEFAKRILKIIADLRLVSLVLNGSVWPLVLAISRVKELQALVSAAFNFLQDHKEKTQGAR